MLAHLADRAGHACPRALDGWCAPGAGVARRLGDHGRARCPCEPGVGVVRAATPAHELLEAVRWMRQLLASGVARAEDIAIAASDPAPFDTHMLALRAQAGIDLHFVRGVPVAASRDGQTASALADILVRGLSHARLRRLVHLCDANAPLLRTLPYGWLHVLPADAVLTSSQSWGRLLARRIDAAARAVERALVLA